MNYISQINHLWRAHEEHQFGNTEVALYMYLLHICNRTAWTNPFKHRNTRICAQLGISAPTLNRSRNKLKQLGLIDFRSNGKGDGNIAYIIIPAPGNERENEKNFTTSVTSAVGSSFTSADAHKVNPDENENASSSSSKKGEPVDFCLTRTVSPEPPAGEEKEKSCAQKEKDTPGATEFDLLFHQHYPTLYESIRRHPQVATPVRRLQLLETFLEGEADSYRRRLPLMKDILTHFRNWVPRYLAGQDSIRPTRPISPKNPLNTHTKRDVHQLHHAPKTDWGTF